jgi:GT2 family glycosyltransferase
MSVRPLVGAVVLTMCNRPVELEAALRSLLVQQGIDLDVVVVGNGCQPVGLPPEVRVLHLAENVGIPEGRNVGARQVRGDLLFFYDDDATLPAVDVLQCLSAAFHDPTVAVAQPRGVDPFGRPAPRRWTPRLRTAGQGGGRWLGGDVGVFWEGVCCIRRTAFEDVGGWPGSFWYGHEGVDLAYRMVDAGWRLRFCPEIQVHHPATQPTRHAVYYRMNARNRVWVARRNLPALLVPVYLSIWIVATVARVRRIGPLRTWFAGFIEGWRSDPGPRRPMSWATVWRLARTGRPPLW